MEYKSQNKICQNCQKDFTIEPEDFGFYEKMQVPPPTWCPECRMIRRFSFTNVWNLYKRNCMKCGKTTLSNHSPDKSRIVYCSSCWWSDSWDGTEYAQKYDSNRSFFEQIKKLTEKTPWQALEADYLTLKNSEYTNAIAHMKNCYMTFWADYCDNVFYSSYLNGLKDSLDCYRMKQSELCYESVGCNKCYRTFFSEECDACTDTWFSRSCSGLVNCFGCVNVRNKSYCIMNEQYSREQYFEKLKEFNLDAREKLEELRKNMFKFWNKYPRRFYIGNALNKNVSGDYIYESKNAKDCYMVSGVEDGRYAQIVSVAKAKDCYDYTGWGNNSEKIYESAVCGEGANNVRFSLQCWPNAMDVDYCIYVLNGGRDCFGCVNMKKKRYCILNKQYSKEEYQELKTKIIGDMKNDYGEFFPANLSLFAYNETVAYQFFPKTKAEALLEGYQWREETKNEYNITQKAKDLPKTIAETEESILNEVIECMSCARAYRFTGGEFDLMRKLNLPLPSECFNCRQKLRFSRTNFPTFYDRKCMKCNEAIRTSYSPERPEIVYCEKCYQQEFS